VDSEAIERKWVTVLNADVVGYSQMAAKDELAAMLALLNAMRWLAMTVEAFGGRVVDTPGDNLMAEFDREQAAVRCALHVQHAVDEGQLAAEGGMTVRFRIGVHSGPLLCQRGRRFGNVVNIAARLQQLAANGGLLVSEVTYGRLPRGLQVRLIDFARFECRNIPQPVGAFRGSR